MFMIPTFNKDLFPDPAEFVGYMHERNIRIGLQLDHTEGVRKEEQSYNAFVKELNLQSTKNIPFNILNKPSLLASV